MRHGGEIYDGDCDMRGMSSLIPFFAAFLFISLAAASCPAGASWRTPVPDQELLAKLSQDEDELNLYCLKAAYPQIKSSEADQLGHIWLLLERGDRVLYRSGRGALQNRDGGEITVAESMAVPYVLEPVRPDLPQGQSPGRARSIRLLEALYGATKDEVSRGLETTRLRGRNISLSSAPAMAFREAVPELERLATAEPALAPFLLPDGGFNWRRIAGENRPSPHSYGIALDLGSKIAPYWRWSKVRPHPLQKSYSGEIVRAMEDRGFIWGGKWHEYDLMHFEYRPELICKARIRGMLEEQKGYKAGAKTGAGKVRAGRGSPSLH